MRALFCAAALFLCVVPGYSETRTPSYTVTIVYRFDGSPSETAFREMRDETRALMGPASLRPEWRDRAEVTRSDSFENLVVVDFHGRCRTGPFDSILKQDQLKQDQPLGRTQVVDGQVLPFIEVECGRVQAFLHSTLWGGQNQNSDVTLGRALGRVLAHELYHVLADTTSHSANGIAKPALSWRDLSSSHLEFAPSDVELMKPEHERPVAVRVARRELRFVP
jgi:hypothetical protein